MSNDPMTRIGPNDFIELKFYNMERRKISRRHRSMIYVNNQPRK